MAFLVGKVNVSQAFLTQGHLDNFGGLGQNFQLGPPPPQGTAPVILILHALGAPTLLNCPPPLSG